MQLYFKPDTKYQSHKHESKMLIEHTNRSTEDKPIIYLSFVKQRWRMVALRQSTWCFNQQSLLKFSQPNVSHNSQDNSIKSTQSQQKLTMSSQCSQHKTSTTKSQHNKVKVNVQPQYVCQSMQPSEIRFLVKVRGQRTKRWPKSTLVKLALKP